MKSHCSQVHRREQRDELKIVGCNFKLSNYLKYFQKEKAALSKGGEISFTEKN